MAKSNWMKDENQKGNFSNQQQDTFDPGKNYLGIRLQQGVPLLDRDWNELEDIRRYAEVMLRKNYIGNGVPDENSFKITAADPPANDFKIAAGRCLVDGFEVVNKPVDPEGNPVGFILYSQQEGVEPLNVPGADRTDTVYLDVWIEEVNGAAEPALKNPQDVDMETCIRHKLCWQVLVNEGSESNPGEEEFSFHWYYSIARIHRKAGEQTIDDVDIVEDLRDTNLALHEIKKANEATDWVTTDKIADKAVTESKIDDSAVTSSKIVKADGTTDQDTSQGDGIKTDHIQDKAVTTAKIDDAAVNTVKLADLAVTNAKLRNGSVNEDKLSTAIRGKLTAMENDFQQILTDAFGASYTLGHDGKPVMNRNLREVVNSILTGMLNGTLPGISPQPLTTDGSGNREPHALVDCNGGIWVFWYTWEDIYYNRFIDGTWNGATPLPTDPGIDECPFALEDHDGTIWVFWHSFRDGKLSIFYKCRIDGEWQSDTQLSAEAIDNAHPFALEDSSNSIWVFWISSKDETHEIRYKKRSSDAEGGMWSENEGIVTTASLPISHLSALEGGSGDIWVFWQMQGSHHTFIHCNRCVCVNGTWNWEENGMELVKVEGLGQCWPFALKDHSDNIWVFWSSPQWGGYFNIVYKRYVNGTWQDITGLTTHSSNDVSPFALEDNNGDIWVFWRSNRTGNADIWYNRFVNGKWIGDRQLSGGVMADCRPFALIDSKGDIRGFWHSGNNIWHSMLIIRI